MAGNDVNVDITVDTRQAEQAAGKLKGIFSEMATIAGAVSLSGLADRAIGEAIKAGTDSVKLARDFNEIQSKSNTIFAEAASQINQWAASASTGFGQSKAQALDAASAFGNMFAQLGVGQQTAAAMSMKMTELASDFASFHNADITEVLNAQQAAFRGEYDALQRFVPTMTAAAVAQEAMAETGKTQASQLTEQEKALAAYNLMLRDAGAAQGDFDRTSGSLANQQRMLSAQWADLQVQIGQVLIPALTAIVTTINTEVIPAVGDFAAKTEAYYNENIRPAIENLKAAFEAISPVIIPILEGIGNHIKNIATILADTASLILAIVSGDWSKAWGDAKAIFGDFIQLFTDDVTAIKDTFTAAIPLAVEAAKAFGSAVAGAVEDALSGVVGFVTSVINGIIDAYNSTLGKVPGAPNISRIGGSGGSSQGYDPNDPTGQHVGGGGAWEAGIAGLAGGGGGGSGWNDLSWPGGMGTPSMNYRDPRGVTLTANDILNMRASSIVIPVTLMLNDQVVYEAVARHGGRIMA